MFGRGTITVFVDRRRSTSKLAWCVSLRESPIPCADVKLSTRLSPAATGYSSLCVADREDQIVVAFQTLWVGTERSYSTPPSPHPPGPGSLLLPYPRSPATPPWTCLPDCPWHSARLRSALECAVCGAPGGDKAISRLSVRIGSIPLEPAPTRCGNN